MPRLLLRDLGLSPLLELQIGRDELARIIHGAQVSLHVLRGAEDVELVLDTRLSAAEEK